MKVNIEKVVIRVYALIMHDGKILLSDEFWYDTPMTKFPGGGLEPGEGIKDCLKRELREELGADIRQFEHLLTYDSFISSEFIPFTQVLPVYYIVRLKEYERLKVSEYRYDFQRLEHGAISLRWINPEQIEENELTFENDRVAFQIFKEKLLAT
jgi:8-oxo-dGTP diphosphatase